MAPEDCSALLAVSTALTALGHGHLGTPEGQEAQKQALKLVAEICETSRDITDDDE